MKNEKNFPGQVAYRVGLDLGSSSIGWCVIQYAWDGSDWRPNGIEGLGVRIFTDGTKDDTGKVRDKSLSAQRREDRGMRRNLARRAWRMHGLFLTLVGAGLLPTPPNLHKGPLAPAIDGTLKELDLELIRMGGDASRLPYHMRANALDRQLTPFELGRALYHLAQRRGFKSNKRADARTDEKEHGKVKEGIRMQREKLEARGARTLGELLYNEDPETERIRARYNARDMVEHEFNAIWEKQKEYHPGLLTDKLKEALHKHIFFQRDLKPVDHMVGYCSLIRGGWITVKRWKRRDGRKLDEPRPIKVYKAPRRLALADPLAQRVRLLQGLNDLKINLNDGTPPRDLLPEQRAWLLEKLQNGDIAFKEIKKRFGLGRQVSLNFEKSAKKALIGDRTAGKMRDVLGVAWDSYSETDKSKLVHLIVKARNTDDLMSKLENEWSFAKDTAVKLANLDLEDGYLSFSRVACKKLLPDLEAGRHLSTIKRKLYDEPTTKESLEEWPRVAHAFPDLRNPVVSRALTELRKVVRAIIRKWGLPQTFTLELARELKKSREACEAITKNNERRSNEREKARKELIDEGLVPNPKPQDIGKYLLWKECGGEKNFPAVCPYTGKPISLTELFSECSPWDIEHIVPHCRSLDNSFANKTLCWSAFNRNYKHNKLPMELGSAKMEEILPRVQAWPNSPAKTRKLDKFLLTEIDEDFVSSQLNDTAYASRLAGEYLARLYGGRSDDQRQQRIYASKGQATAQLRGQWKLNKLLGGLEKNRGDHRHHAIDAIVIALSTPAMLKALAEASQNPTDPDRMRFAPIPPPWENFLESVAQSLDNIVVSRQSKRKLSGRLHEETNHGAIGEGIIAKRYGVEELAKKHLEDDFETDGVGIINPVIKARIMAQLETLGIDDPKKAFKDKKDHPYLIARDGRHIPIHKVKLAFRQRTVDVGTEHRKRRVIPDSNYCMVVFEVKDDKGGIKWDYKIVSLLDATRRHSMRLPVVEKGPGFVMTLGKGDTVMYEQDGKVAHAWVRTVKSNGKVGLAPHTDARKKDDQDYREVAINVLRTLNFRKTQVDPLGEIRISRD